MTINKTTAPGQDTGPQAAVPASAALTVWPARWLRAAVMTTRPRQWPKNLLVLAAAKLRLADVPPDLITDAMRPGRRLVARVRLTDDKGNPVCARLHPSHPPHLVG